MQSVESFYTESLDGERSYREWERESLLERVYRERERVRVSVKRVSIKSL